MKLAKGLRDSPFQLKPEFGKWVGVHVVIDGTESYRAGRIKSWNQQDAFVVFIGPDWENFSDYPTERLPLFVLHSLTEEQIKSWQRCVR